MNDKREVYIVDGARTPFLKARNKIGPFKGSDLGVQAARALLARQSFSPQDIDEVICGCAIPDADEANIARVIGLRVGCGDKVPAFTVQRNCASGLQALDNAMQNIATGRSDLVLAGGTDAMSRARLVFDDAMATWLMQWVAAKTFAARMSQLTRFKPKYFMPIIALKQGLTDPVVGLDMGQTAENLAYRFNITRDEMDSYALRSHQRLQHAIDENYFQEIASIIDNNGNAYTFDDGVRPDGSLEKLAKLKPFFDKKFGMVTAGNSSQITDGSAFLILASRDAVKKYQLPVVAKIVDVAWQALDPAQMGLGPVYASSALLKRHGLARENIDAWEINEAFAAQVIACNRAFEDADFCKDELGLDKPFGAIDESKLNIDGGAIACGHPIGASGARISLHLARVLERTNGQYGVASLCVGGGQGGAILLERVEGA